MLNRIKGIIARVVLRHDTDYAMYCILSTLSSNVNGLTYKTVESIYKNYFSKTVISVAWQRAFAAGYIRRVDFTNVYIIGVDILFYTYEILL